MNGVLYRTLKQCYGTSKYPIGLVNITVKSPENVDINQEPNKYNVLISDQEILLKAIEESLMAYYGHSDTGEQME